MRVMNRMRKYISLARDERGSAAIEFTITLPIIILAMLMIFDIGRATHLMSTLSSAANDTVRYASAHATDNLIPRTETQIIAFANTRLGTIGPGSAVAVTFTEPAGGDPTLPFVSGGEVSVRITQTLNFYVFSFINIPPQEFVGRADMIVL